MTVIWPAFRGLQYRDSSCDVCLGFKIQFFSG